VTYPPHIWNQLKNKSFHSLVSALRKDGWIPDETKGAEQVYRHPDGRRVVLHYHPSKTYGPNLLKALLKDIGWTEDDMRCLKLIK